MSGDDFLETEEEMIQRLKIIFVLGIFFYIFPFNSDHLLWKQRPVVKVWQHMAFRLLRLHTWCWKKHQNGTPMQVAFLYPQDCHLSLPLTGVCWWAYSSCFKIDRHLWTSITVSVLKRMALAWVLRMTWIYLMHLRQDMRSFYKKLVYE